MALTNQRGAKRAIAAALAVVCLVLLGGCFKVDVDLEVKSDDTVSGTMIIAISRDVPDAESSVEELTNGLPEGVTVEEWSDDRFVGYELTYDDVEISQFSAPSGSGDAGTALRREGDYFIFGDPDASVEDVSDFPFQPVYRVKLTFPGKVVDTNGQANGNSVEWTDFSIPPYAKAEASGGILVPVLIAVGAVVLLAVAAVVVFLILRSRSSNTPPGGPQTAPYDPTAFSGATVDQQGQWGQQAQQPQQGQWGQQQGQWGQQPQQPQQGQWGQQQPPQQPQQGQ